MKFRRDTAAFTAAFLLAFSSNQCRTTDRDAAGLKAVVVESREGEAGYTTFFVEGDELKRYRCPALLLATGSDQQPIDDPKFVRGQCNEAPSETGNKVTLKVFEAKLKSVYLVAVDDAQLTVQEADVLKNLTAAMKAPPGAKPELKMLPSEQPAMERIQARFAGLLDTAFDFEDATPEKATVSDSQGRDGGLQLAGETEVDFGQLRFKSTFSGVAPFPLTFDVAPNLAVDTVSLVTMLDPTGVCKTRVVGLGAVTVATPIGPKLVSVTAHPVNANSWMINNGVPAMITRLQVLVKKPALTLSQNCILIVRGKVASGGTVHPPEPLPDRDSRMKALMTSRSHRMWHYLWHGIRNSWPRMTALDRQNVRQFLGQAWAREDAETLLTPEPDKGEEFLHMHRVMIQMVQNVLGPEMYERWKEPPSPNDPAWPLPGGQNFQTNQEYQQLRAWHLQAVDGNWLRQMTLGQFGEFIELGLHNTMHMRWADETKAIPEVMAGGLFQQPKPEWDLPSNDYLGSTYSAHVNPVFWRLHGYVDDRIEDWLKANGYSSIAEDCHGVPTCYQWRRVWDGPLPASHGGPMAAAAAASSHEAVESGFEGLPKTLARMINDNSVMFPVLL